MNFWGCGCRVFLTHIRVCVNACLYIRVVYWHLVSHQDHCSGTDCTVKTCHEVQPATTCSCGKWALRVFWRIYMSTPSDGRETWRKSRDWFHYFIWTQVFCILFKDILPLPESSVTKVKWVWLGTLDLESEDWYLFWINHLFVVWTRASSVTIQFYHHGGIDSHHIASI